MSGGGRMLAGYAVLTLYGAAGVVGVARLATYGFSSDPHALMMLGLLVMSVVFTVLRVPMGNNSNVVSLGSVVSFLSIPLIGIWPSVGMKFFGIIVGGTLTRTKPIPDFLTSILAAAGVLSMATLIGGSSYVAAGGGVGSLVIRSAVYPYVVMVAAYLAGNIVALAVWRSLGRQKGFMASAMESLRSFWFNHVVLAVTGLLSLILISQLHWLGMLVVTAALVAVRFAFQLYADSKQVRSELASVLTEALKFKDPYTAEHSRRVAEMSVRVGRRLGLTDLELEKLYDSALLHDIGKIAVPDAVLVKPGPLDSTEWKSMERHVGAGGEILEQSPHLKELAGFVRAHHTDYDGTTRPEALPIAARIIGAADAFDAMTSDRPYRKALPLEEAIRRLHEGAGTQFDPQVVEALLRGLLEASAPATPGGPHHPAGPLGEDADTADGRADPAPGGPSGSTPLQASGRLRFPFI